MNNIEKFLDELKVYNTGLTKMRLGPPNDGGYVVFKEACEKSNSVYTYGVGDDVGFELDIIEKFPNIETIILHDPTIDKLPKQHDKFKFKKLGIEDSFCFSKKHNPTLKIDVEYNEWEALSRFYYKEFEKIPQIIIEFHLVDMVARAGLSPYFYQLYDSVSKVVNNSLFEHYHDVLLRLNKFFIIGHIHVNNSLPLMEINGYMIPPLIEVTFINKNIVESPKQIDVFETNTSEFDSPNKTDRKDIIFKC